MKKNVTRYYNIEIPTENLELINDIWFSKKKSDVSFPEDGYNKILQIEENSFWFQHRINVIITAIKNFPPSGIFYDIGGGNGFVSLALQKKGIETILIEPGKIGAYNAKKRGLKNIICAKIEEIGLEKNSISAAGLFDVLEHIKDDRKYLSLLFSLIKIQGKLYITTPAYNFLWSSYDKNSGHFKRYTIKKLSKILKPLGFKIIYKTHFFSLLPIPIFLFRTLPSILKIKRNIGEIENIKREHSYKGGFIGKVLKNIWNFELRFIMNGKKIPFGGSCFIIAQKSNLKKYCN